MPLRIAREPPRHVEYLRRGGSRAMGILLKLAHASEMRCLVHLYFLEGDIEQLRRAGDIVIADAQRGSDSFLTEFACHLFEGQASTQCFVNIYHSARRASAEADVLLCDNLALTERHCPLDDVFQLAHVARPV